MDDDELYTELAKRVFAEFLEMRDQRQDVVERKEHDKIVKQFTKAVTTYKETIADFALQIEENERAIARLEDEKQKLREQLNEAIINGQLGERIKKVSHDHPFTEHMSERSYQEWKKLMQEIPRGR